MQSLSWLWQATGLLQEGFESTELALARSQRVDPGLEGYGWLTLGNLAAARGSIDRPRRSFCGRSLPLLDQAPRHSHVYALCTLAGLLSMHDSGEAQALLRQAEHEARTLGDQALVT